MPELDKATERALARYNEEQQTSSDITTAVKEPRFKTILAEEVSEENSACMQSPEAVQQCPDKEKKQDPNCTVESLEIRQKGKSRKITLTKDKNNQVLEVVSGNAKWLSEWMTEIADFNLKEIEVKPVGLVGPCKATHLDKTFDFDEKAIEITDDLLKFKTHSNWAFIPWNAAPAVYEIRHNTCSTALVGKINVYPDIEFGVGVEFKVQEEITNRVADVKVGQTDSQKKIAVLQDDMQGQIDKIRKEGRKFGRKASKAKQESITDLQRQISQLQTTDEDKMKVEIIPHDKIKITESLSIFGFYKFSNQEIEIRKILKDIIEKLQTIDKVVATFQSVMKQLEALQEGDLKALATEKAEEKLVVGKSGVNVTGRSKSGIVPKFFFPMVGIKFSGLWEEIDDEPICQYGMAMSFYSKPLFGMEFKYDITYAILKAFGPAGATISKLKEFAEEKGLKALAVVVSANFKINMEFRMELNSYNESNNPGATVQVEGSIKVQVTVVSYEDTIVGYTVKVDIGGSGESGIVMTGKANQSKLSLDFEWTGIKLTIFKTCTFTKTEEKKTTPPPSKYDNNVAKTGNDNEYSYKIKGRKIPDIYNYLFN